MQKANVLVIGNSGVGKSTLINAVIGNNIAPTGWGTTGTTDKLEIYENPNIPFRIIDSVGFEPDTFKRIKAVNAVKKWSKESVKEGKDDTQINVIWFCIDGTSSKLFADTIKSLSSATKMWESVPVIVVITKSYSLPERQNNIEMVNNAFAKQKRYTKNLRRVLPVVAQPYVIEEGIFVPPFGIMDLIDATNDLLPEGVKAADIDINKFKLNRKRALSQSVVGLATISAVTVGAVPIPFADGLILTPIEVTEINTIAKIYDINKNDDSKKFINTIVEVGTAGAVAKMAISALKTIPVINIGASALNAIIAGSMVAAIGEAAIFAFEQVYLGNKTLADLDWVKKITESQLTNGLVDKVKRVMENIGNNPDPKSIGKVIFSEFN